MGENQPPLTKGYVERAIINELATDGYNTKILTTGGLCGTVEEVGIPNQSAWAKLAAEQTGREDTVRASSVRRALNRMREKGLVERFEELDDPDYDSFYTVGGDVTPRHGPSDGRESAWALTRSEGVSEVKWLDKRYINELGKILKQHGRLATKTGIEKRLF